MTIPRLLVDTNVWLDHYLARLPRQRACTALLTAAAEGQAALLVTAPVLKDLYYLLSVQLKRDIRSEKGQVSEEDALAVDELAWACTRNALELASVTPVGAMDVWDAFTLRAAHPDFEDDLLLAAARSAGADAIVTGDRKLAQHAPVPCLTPEEWLESRR